MKALKKIVIWSACILAIAMVSAFALITIYEDEVTTYAIEELTKHLKTEVNTRSVNLTLWNQFPSASLQFKDVYIEETLESKDTLLYAESLYLNFSITDFLTGNYAIKEVALSNSELHLKKLKNGTDNYHFWKESESKNEKFQLSIENIALRHSQIFYKDEVSETDLNVTANNVGVSGVITDETLDFKGDIETQVHLLKVSDVTYLENKSLSGTSHLTVELAEELYTIKNTQLYLNELPLDITGTVDLEEKHTLLNLSAESSNARLNDAVNNLPEFVKSNLSGFHAAGDFTCNVSIKGSAGNGKSPDISGNYAVSNGDLENKSSGISLDDISLKGSYSAPFGKEDLLTLSVFNCSLGEDKINGSGKVSRLSNPFINAEAEGTVNFKTLHEFLNIESVESMEGQSNIELKYKGNLGKNWQPTAQNIKHADLSGRVAINNGALKLNYNQHKIEEFSGELLFSGGDAAVNKLHGQIAESDFVFDGFFRNVLGYLLLPDENLKIESSLTSSHLDLNSLLSKTSSESSEDYKFNLPKNVDMSLNATVNSLEFREFKAQSLMTHVEMKPNILRLSKVDMKTAKGKIQGNLSANQHSNGNFLLTSKGTIEGVDISELFSHFEDFHQEFITHNHLKGIASTDFSFSAAMTNGLDLLTQSVEVDADIKLADGELINHSTLQEIGVFMKEKKLIGAFMNVNAFQERLKHIKFSELENQIRIKNNIVTMPKMSIESDALNIIAEGSHTFSNQIDYSFGFDLADLTRRDGLEEDEKGLSKLIFISLKGSTENPHFNYDRASVKEQRKENRKHEVHKIRDLVKKEFTSKEDAEKTTTPKQSKLKVEWGDSKKEEKKNKTQEKTPGIMVSEPDSEEESDDDDF